MRPVSSFACALGLCLAIVSAATAQQPQPPSPARPDSAHPRSRPSDSWPVSCSRVPRCRSPGRIGARAIPCRRRGPILGSSPGCQAPRFAGG